MSLSFLSLAEALLIAVALSTDAFVSSFAYGAGKIKIPIASAWVITFICSGTLAAALLFGGAMRTWIPGSVTAGICFLLLCTLGCIKMFESALKALIRRHNAFEKKIRFSLLQLSFVLKVYANPEEADRDRSRTLFPGEAAYLALALSLDGLAVGFGAGIRESSPLMIILFSLLLSFLSVLLGARLGGGLAERKSLDLGWLGGILLIALAFLKLL